MQHGRARPPPGARRASEGERDRWPGTSGGPTCPAAVRRHEARARARPNLKKEGPAGRARRDRRGARSPAAFWGKAWCDNLERYSDFANRLPRGRTYVRNGSVMDLAIGPGTVKALVSGSELYRMPSGSRPAQARWRAVVRECTGRIGSLVELLQGELSRAVMDALIRRETGLFPAAGEIAVRLLLPGLGGDVQARRGRSLRRRRPPRRRARAVLPVATRRSTGPAHRGQHRRGLAARAAGGQADRRDRAGRGLWDRAGRVLEGARHATGGRTRETAEGSVGRRPDSTGTCHRPRPRSPRRGAPAPGDSQCQGRPAGPPARRSHRRATGD